MLSPAGILYQHWCLNNTEYQMHHDHKDQKLRESIKSLGYSIEELYYTCKKQKYLYYGFI